jgi:FtsP/CotA-like multicopper oxidase with cupredoxin domain
LVLLKEVHVKEANRRIANDGNQGNSFSNEPATCCEVECVSPRTSRWYFAGKALAIAGGVALAVAIALSLLEAPPTAAQNLGSDPFANPSEVHYRVQENRLRAVMQLSAGTYSVPNLGSGTFRQFRGWDAAAQSPTPVVSPSPPPVSPGPTLRARLGDMVEISFLNQINDNLFPYTFVTDSMPGVSDFGCDRSGTRDPKTHKFMTYPGDDKFPNCFHGSSTANIHFHGTHSSPDGLSDNVLVQVLPQTKQPGTQVPWTVIFDKMFDSGKIPQVWAEMPPDYRRQQEDLVKQYDKDATAAALNNKLRPPDSLWAADKKMIDAGLWPQYLVGAFPNFFQIPDYSSGNYKAGQAPGTHWYHAHKHGSTSLHILNGLAGAFIIESSHEGGYDHVIRKFYDWGDTYGDHEKILIFQEYETIQNLERQGAGVSRGIKQVLVNGLLKPTITMAPGEVQLWRLVNATEGNSPGIIQPTLFQTAGFTFKQTAQDGVQLSPDNYHSQPFLTAAAPNGKVPNGLTLAAGNRADLLVQAPTTPGVTAEFKSGETTLFLVKVTGSPVTEPNGPFPIKWAEMPKFLSDLPRPGLDGVINQNSPVKFQWEDGRINPGLTPFPPHFMINGKQFGQTGEVIDQCMPLDGLQDWVLENYTGLAHPFHIHVNPFQVIAIDTPTGRSQYSQYRPTGGFVWQDTIAIPPAKIVTNKDGKITNVTPGRVTIRQTYLDFTGTYVLHCHILAHEDRGMMQLVRVVPAAKYPAGCQDSVPAHH